MPSTQKKSLSTGAWIFLSAIIVVAALIIITVMISSDRQQSAVRDAKTSSESYNKCMDEAYDAYKKQWDDVAASIGSTNGKIPNSDAEFLDKRHKEAKDECFRLYN